MNSYECHACHESTLPGPCACVENSEIERLRAENTELREVLEKKNDE